MDLIISERKKDYLNENEDNIMIKVSETKNFTGVIDAEYMALRLIDMDSLEADSTRFKMLEAEFDRLFDKFSDEEKRKIFFIYHGLMSLKPDKRKSLQASILGRIYDALMGSCERR